MSIYSGSDCVLIEIIQNYRLSTTGFQSSHSHLSNIHDCEHAVYPENIKDPQKNTEKNNNPPKVRVRNTRSQTRSSQRTKTHFCRRQFSSLSLCAEGRDHTRALPSRTLLTWFQARATKSILDRIVSLVLGPVSKISQRARSFAKFLDRAAWVPNSQMGDMVFYFPVGQCRLGRMDERYFNRRRAIGNENCLPWFFNCCRPVTEGVSTKSLHTSCPEYASVYYLQSVLIRDSVWAFHFDEKVWKEWK